jgi:hypothetical protein
LLCMTASRAAPVYPMRAAGSSSMWQQHQLSVACLRL